jgi:hypothetical protein
MKTMGIKSTDLTSNISQRELKSVTARVFSHTINESWHKRLILLTSGFLLGSGISVGIGLGVTESILFGLLSSLGVYLTGSLFLYLLVQTAILAGLALSTRAILSLDRSIIVSPEMFHFGYILLLVLAPLVALIFAPQKIRSIFKVSISLELAIATSFAALVIFLRSRMPSDASYALSQLYLGEDNAGIIENLAKSLNFGYGIYAMHFGEFINGIYLAVGKTLSVFVSPEDTGLVPALTHFNLTLLLMAWAPLASYVAYALSGVRQAPRTALVVVGVMSSIFGLLFWPFTLMGHSAVIFGGLLAMPFLAITLNRDLATKHPIFFAIILISLGILTSNTWFPLGAFVAVVIVMAIVGLMQIQFRADNKKLVWAFVFISLAVFLIYLPEVIKRILSVSSYLQIGGGTRNASLALSAVWLLLVFLVLWQKRKDSADSVLLGTTLFILTMLTLVGSSFYLLLSGYLGSGESFGYGATKYFVTAIGFSLPVLFLVATQMIGVSTIKGVFLTGVLTVSIIFMAQPDSRMVPATIVFPSFIPFLAPVDASALDSSVPGVITALKEAVSKDPDQILCVSDFAFPYPDGEISMESYLCSRWGGSLLGDSDKAANWRFVPLDRGPVEGMETVRGILEGDDVILIRFTTLDNEGSPTLDVSETWWGAYVDDDWAVITVK